MQGPQWPLCAGGFEWVGLRPDLASDSAPSRPLPDSLWGWDLSPAVPATSYEAFNPAVATFSHPQGVQLCYGPSTYSPVGSLDPAPSVEAPGPSFPAYPTEDFTSQVRGRDTINFPIIGSRFPRCQAACESLWVKYHFCSIARASQQRHGCQARSCTGGHVLGWEGFQGGGPGIPWPCHGDGN